MRRFFVKELCYRRQDQHSGSFLARPPYCMVKQNWTVNKIAFIAALYAVLCASCLGQEQPAAPSAEAAKTNAPKGQISGQVLDSSTGQPLKKAWVTARQAERGGRSGSTTVTDAQGNFLLKDLDAGRYVLSVQRNGYVSQVYGQKSAGEQGTTISLSAGQNLMDIVFRLIQGGVITGRVVDEDSEPLAHAQVQALQFRYMQGRRRLVPVGGATSDDRGEYRIFGIRPGQVYVRAMLRGFGFVASGETMDPSAPSETTAYPPVFYPNVLDASQAAPLTVRGGDELHVDFSMSPQRSYSVSGRVVGGVQGSSGRGTWLMLMKHGEGIFAFGPGLNTTTREDNTFTFKQVLPGSYDLIAQQQEDTNSASARVEVDVREGDVQGVILSLSPKVDVTGHISFDTSPTPKLTGINIALSPQDMQDFMRGAYGQVKDDGSFTLQAAPDDRYRIAAYGLPAGSYLKSASAGRDDVLEKGYSPASSRNLDLVFGTGAKLTGTINTPDGKGEPGVTVLVAPDRKLAGLADEFRTASTDQNGKYQVQGLRPGSYRVYAFEHIDPGAYEDETWLNGLADLAQTVRLSEGGQENLDLKLIPAGQDAQ